MCHLGLFVSVLINKQIFDLKLPIKSVEEYLIFYKFIIKILYFNFLSKRLNHKVSGINPIMPGVQNMVKRTLKLLQDFERVSGLYVVNRYYRIKM